MQAKQAVRSKQMSEQFERTSELTNEWPTTYVPILGCSKPLCGGCRGGDFSFNLKSAWGVKRRDYGACSPIAR